MVKQNMAYTFNRVFFSYKSGYSIDYGTTWIYLENIRLSTKDP